MAWYRAGGSKPKQNKTVTPKATAQTVKPDAGKELAQVTVNGDADLKAENIKKGINIFGIDGNLVEGADLSPMGLNYSKIAVDTYIPATDIQVNQVGLPHSLGEIPKMALIRAKVFPTKKSGYQYLTYCFAAKLKTIYNDSDINMGAAYRYSPYNSSSANSIVSFVENTAATIKISDSTAKFEQGSEYEIITLA